MKNYNEIANSIFKRRDVYITERNKKRRKALRLTAVLSFVMIIVLAGAWVLKDGGTQTDDGTANSIENTMQGSVTPTPTNAVAATPTSTNTVAATSTPTNTVAATPTPTNTVAVTPTPTNTVAATPTPYLSTSQHKKSFDTVEALVAYAQAQPRWKSYAFIPVLKNIEDKFVIYEILANDTYVWISYVDTSSTNVEFPVSLQIGMMTTTDHNGYLGWAKNVIGGTEATVNGKSTVVRKNSFTFHGQTVSETYYLFNEGNVEMLIRVPEWAEALGTAEYFTDLEHIPFA